MTDTGDATTPHPGEGNFPGRVWRPPDPRNRAHPLSAQVPADERETPYADLPASRYWPQLFAPYDQGRESSCVGQTWHALLRGHPVPYHRLPATPYQMYRHFQTLDVWDGDEETPPRYQGTSTLAGAKWCHQAGYISGYAWGDLSVEATTWDALLVCLRHLAFVGPLAIGVDWHRGMWETDPQGYVHALGPVDGGHEVKVLGYSKPRTALRLVNSWGAAWGQNGRCWLSFDDFRLLMDHGGDACAPKETKVVAP